MYCVRLCFALIDSPLYIFIIIYYKERSDKIVTLPLTILSDGGDFFVTWVFFWGGHCQINPPPLDL